MRTVRIRQQSTTPAPTHQRGGKARADIGHVTKIAEHACSTFDNSIEYESEYEYRFAEYEYDFGNARSVTIPKG